MRGSVPSAERRVPTELPLVPALAGMIEFGGAVIVAVAVGRALTALAGGAGIERARLLVIAGSLSALGYKSAATLLKAIELGTWHGIGAFAAIFALRTMIKQALTWERSRIVEPVGKAEGRFTNATFESVTTGEYAAMMKPSAGP